MNVCVFYYDGFSEFEVVISYLCFRDKNVFSAALENRTFVSEETQKFLPDKTINELDPKEIDLFIIPGGDPDYLYENESLRNFILELNEQNKYIAGICGGTELMAKFGILDNKKCTGNGSGIKPDAKNIDVFKNCLIQDEDVVVDGNTITATGQSFIEFALELGKIMNIFKDEKELEEDYKWLKNIKK